MDLNLQALKRRATAGDPEAEAGVIRSRLRIGELDLVRVEAAANVGYGPALAALGERKKRVFNAWREPIESVFDPLKPVEIAAWGMTAMDRFLDRVPVWRSTRSAGVLAIARKCLAGEVTLHDLDAAADSLKAEFPWKEEEKRDLGWRAVSGTTYAIDGVVSVCGGADRFEFPPMPGKPVDLLPECPIRQRVTFFSRLAADVSVAAWPRGSYRAKAEQRAQRSDLARLLLGV